LEDDILFSQRLNIALIFALLCISTNTVATQFQSLYKRPTSIPFPANNPYSTEKATLGKMLFFDPRLSKNKNMNCATCHNPSFGWEDATATSVGSQNTHLTRHSPTIINLAWGKTFFWDGRAKTLEEQAQGPIESDVEMNIPLEEVVSRLKNVDKYQELFTRVFGRSGITGTNIRKSIATFERTIVSGVAPFDRWIDGDKKAISDSAKRGFELFNNKADCAVCHSGWNFTDNEFHDIVLFGNDKGLGALNNNPSDNFAFKTPSLRNISQRAPYMHDGRFDRLSTVIAHYNGPLVNSATRSKKLKNINLSQQEIIDLTEFLLTLTGSDTAVTLPILPF